VITMLTRLSVISRLLFTLLLLQLVACRSVAPPATAVTGSSNNEQFFIAAWQADQPNQAVQSQADYLGWVARFYSGGGNVSGWQQMTDQVLARVPAEQHDTLVVQLDTLGRQIGAEWAKDNSIRLIDTRIVATWRDALLEALSRQDLAAYIAKLTADLEALMGRSLQVDAIRFERYYEDEFDS
jgi:hypothetical protein